MSGRLDIVQRLGQHPFGIDDEGRAGATHVGPAVVLLFSPGAISVVNGHILVEQKREIEVVFGGEIIVALTAVLGDTEHDHIGAGQARHIIAEIARLFGTSGGAVPGVEIQDDGFSLTVQLGQIIGGSGVIGGRESGGNLANLQVDYCAHTEAISLSQTSLSQHHPQSEGAELDPAVGELVLAQA